MKHSPGPWAWQLFGDTYTLTAQHGRREQIIAAIPHGEMKYPVVAMNKDGRLVDVDPEFPNARLIASAPDLLAALQTFGGTGDGFCSCPIDEPAQPEFVHSTQCQMARAAILKAQS